MKFFILSFLMILWRPSGAFLAQDSGMSLNNYRHPDWKDCLFSEWNPHNHFQKEILSFEDESNVIHIYDSKGCFIPINRGENNSLEFNISNFIYTVQKGYTSFNSEQKSIYTEAKSWKSQQGFSFDTLETRPADIYMVIFYSSLTQFTASKEDWKILKEALFNRFDLFIDIYFVHLIEKSTQEIYPLHLINNDAMRPMKER